MGKWSQWPSKLPGGSVQQGRLPFSFGEEMGRSAEKNPQDRIDPHEILWKMSNVIGGLRKGKLASTARLYGTSPDRLRSVLNKNKRMTVDCLLVWAHRLYRKTGVRVVLTFTPDQKIYYSIIDARNEKIEGTVSAMKKIE